MIEFTEKKLRGPILGSTIAAFKIAYLLMCLFVWLMVLEKREPSAKYEKRVRSHINDTQNNVDVAFIGDSIVEGFDLGKFFGNEKYPNRGIAGDMTVGVYNRLNERWQKGTGAIKSAGLVFPTGSPIAAFPDGASLDHRLRIVDRP